jgi:hypothetical protein
MIISGKSVAIGLALACMAISPSAFAKGTKVTVDGQLYRVVVRANGKEAWVYNKATVVSMTPLEKDRRIRAAKLVTGCDLTNVERMDISYAGILVCPDGVTPKE